ncbi:cbb3-type cytochrome oxidase assembly protein CcoS [Ignatzschineria sp. LJL83]
MSPLFILLPLTLAGMVAAGYAFIWAVRSDQFDDMEGPAHQILFDEDIRPLEEKKVEKSVEQGSSLDETQSTSKERIKNEN